MSEPMDAYKTYAFWLALNMMVESGFHMRRAGWGPAGRVFYYKGGFEMAVVNPLPVSAFRFGEMPPSAVVWRPQHIPCLMFTDGQTCGTWTPLQEDLLARDWKQFP